MLLLLDKIGSVAKNAKLQRRVEVNKHIPSHDGQLIAVEVLSNKKIYNELELCSGRLSVLHKGDTVAVALGSRRALKGFVGEAPHSLKPGDLIHMLNLGGVAGICRSSNVKEVGRPLKLKVLGAIMRRGKPLNIKDFRLFAPQNKLLRKTPLIIVSGTCMDVGKTTVACEIIKTLTSMGKKIFGAKIAGVAAMRDTENMKDSGAILAVSFVDAGYPSTARENGNMAKIMKGALNYLAERKPSAIIVEFGDGILGEYGVMDILKDPEIRDSCVFHAGCANDPPGALKLAEIAKKIGVPLDAVCGPVTDNAVGVEFVERHIRLPACNALETPEKLWGVVRACAQALGRDF